MLCSSRVGHGDSMGKLAPQDLQPPKRQQEPLGAVEGWSLQWPALSPPPRCRESSRIHWLDVLPSAVPAARSPAQASGTQWPSVLETQGPEDWVDG